MSKLNTKTQVAMYREGLCTPMCKEGEGYTLTLASLDQVEAFRRKGYTEIEWLKWVLCAISENCTNHDYGMEIINEYNLAQSSEPQKMKV